MTDPTDSAGASEPPTGDIGRRAVAGTLVSFAASAVTLVLGGTRLLLLTHWLLPADVGLFAQSLVIVGLAVQTQYLGLAQAFLHRRQVDRAFSGTYYALALSLQGAALVVVATCSTVVGRAYPEMPGLTAVILAVAAIETLRGVNETQMATVNRRLAFSEVAVADIASSLAMTVAAPLAAWLGWGVWSLVVEQAAGTVTRFVVFHLVYRLPAPHFAWDPAAARWLLGYGWPVWKSTGLAFVANRFPDVWLGRVLGADALGLYSRAGEVASYPRRLVSIPVLRVFLPTFARLADDRLRLSRAFFRATALMVRAGLGLGLLLVVVAEPLLRLVGPQWLPMLPALRILAVYAVVVPVAEAARDLLFAIGRPQAVSRARALQVAFTVPGVLLGGALGGVVGVAAAAAVAAAATTCSLARAAHRHVDYSLRAMWLWPLVAGAAAAAAGVAATLLVVSPGWALVATTAAVVVVYAAVLAATERRQVAELIADARSRLASAPPVVAAGPPDEAAG